MRITRETSFSDEVESEVSTRSVVSDEAQGLRWAFAEKALVVGGAGGGTNAKNGFNPQPLPLLGLLAPALWALKLLPPYSSAVFP